MHIGLLTSDLTYKHGWGNYSLNLIHALKQQGHKLTIIASEDSELIDGFDIYPVLPSIVSRQRMFLARLAWSYRKILPLLADCDVIHVTIEKFAPLIPLIAQQRPSFITAHGSYINLPNIRSFPVGQLYRYAFQNNHIICVSHYTQSVAKQVVPKAETSVILNAVDSNHFTDIKRQFTSHPIVVTTGGVKARKGTLQLVRAIATVRNTLPDIQCHILGTLTAEAGYVDLVRREIKDNQLDEIIHLHGFVSDSELRDWYAKADVFALPSINAGWKFEGFGLAILEASAAGVAVIGTWGCGAENAIDHQETGLLISQDNIDQELPQAILTLLQDREKARLMGLAGRRKAQAYTWDDVATKLTVLYQSKL